MDKKNKEYEVTSGNIFADLGLPDSDDLLARAELLRKVEDLIKASGLPQKEIAAKLDISQPKVSMLVSGHLSAFSSDTLFRYLIALGCDVQIRVKKPRSPAGIFRHRGHVAVC
jgi:predicted XRE-type DNA-binding protein